MTVVVDAWANLRSPTAARAWATHPELTRVTTVAGSTSRATAVRTIDDVVVDLDACDADVAIVSGGAGTGALRQIGNYTIDEVLDSCLARLDRVRGALTLSGLAGIGLASRQIDRVASHPALAVVRVIPSVLKEPIASRRFYPIYERFEAFGIPVSINVGFGAPGAPATLQDPVGLEDVLVDFPELVVVAAHGGHPWESELVRLMCLHSNLQYSPSAVLARYLDPVIVEYMGSSAGRTQMIFASDSPQLSLDRALVSARELPIDDDAMHHFLGENASRVFGLAVPSTPRRSPV